VKAAIYARCATSAQQGAISIRKQIAACRAKANALGGSVASNRIYVDREVSGVDISRLGRSRSGLMEFYRACQRAGMQIICVRGDLNPRSFEMQ
jgi:DNA invertase Pin-like site-specific DNA recombinase